MVKVLWKVNSELERLELDLYNTINHPSLQELNDEYRMEQIKYQWVFIEILYYEGSNRKNKIIVFTYNMPRWIYETRQWVVRWRLAYLQCKYPRQNIESFYSYYTPNENRKIEIDHQIRARKAQVTKWTNVIRLSKEIYAKTLFPEGYKTDPIFKKYEEKLELNKAKLEMLMNQNEIF